MALFDFGQQRRLSCLLFSEFNPPLFSQVAPFFFLSAIRFAVRKNLLFDSTDGSLKHILPELTFPYDDDIPSFCFKATPDLLVSFLIPSDLCCPEIHIGLGNSIVLATSVTVPKASVNKDDCAVLGKDNIWGAWESSIIYTIAVTKFPDCFS